MTGRNRSHWTVTLFNQHAMCSITAQGKTRPVAFKRSLAKAGEEFIRYGGDKASEYRHLFYDILMKKSNGFTSSYASGNLGAGVEYRAVFKD